MTLANPHGVIHLSVNPWYFCNFRCTYCYLTPQQLGDRQLLDLDELDTRLHQITGTGHHIGCVDIYGGEVMLLPQGYLQELKRVVQSHEHYGIELITNLSSLDSEVIGDEDFGLSVSYDFQHRQQHEHVFKNMLKLNRPFTVLTLATEQVLRLNVEEALQQLSLLRNLMAWEIKPYSSNQANQAPMDFQGFEALVKAVITAQTPRKFEFLNETMLAQAVRGERNSFSDDHLYITPRGKFAVLEFDAQQHEYFLELDTFEDYLRWTLVEKGRVYDNGACGSCEFMGKCLSEHLRHVKDLNNSCNGFFNLIKWGEKQWS